MAADDGSSSSLYSSGSPSTFDVYLNFSGTDTRNNFTGLLYSALKREGIAAFMDSADLPVGEEIEPAILEAIRRSKISIPIFSKHYADSRWCLNELVEMVRCHKSNGQLILPIYFDVDPSDVRRQTGSFEESFQKHQDKFDAQTIKCWKEALRVVAGIAGYESYLMNQSELIDSVVDRASSELSRSRLTYDVYLNFRGIDTRRNFTDLLYSALNSVGILAFTDSAELRVGEEIGPAILEAIRRSKISIPIFSKHYADSRWCLDELVEMVRCHESNGQLILPIYFDVDPSDVRRQTGSFEESFQKHQDKFDAQTIKCWKEALRVVAGIAGYEYYLIKNPSELIDSVVDRASSELSRSRLTYDVYLNFSGTDTRNKFTGLLYSALKRGGIAAFMDSADLLVGEEIGPAILEAIRRSKISIPIFSKHYADSRWCLHELVEMVRCHKSNGQLILPIFYDVQPRDVCHQTGSFEQSFRKHEAKFDAQTIRSWKNALAEAGALKGYVIEQWNAPEIVDSVVGWASSELDSSRKFMVTRDGASSACDVYLSFRGKDTGNNFISFLHRALQREGIAAFMDSEDLPVGEEIGPASLAAIQRSKVSIIVFSKNYADSRWCLDEVVEIVQCHISNGQIILPIFYDVEPSDVRHQTGSFEQSFRKHEAKVDAHTVRNWKDALAVVGGLNGYVINTNQLKWDLLKVIKLVVGTASDLVVGRASSELSTSHLGYVEKPIMLIGLHACLNDLLLLLNVGFKDVRFVGICGVSGIGKTTIAKALYNRIFKHFNKSCFLANIREEALTPKGLVTLQEQLLSIVSGKKAEAKISNVHKGQNLIKERLRGANVLLILDDVDCLSQLEALAIESNWFGPGSRIIITSSDENILNLAKVDEGRIYRPKKLNAEQSLELFSLYAFSRDQLPSHYEELSREVIRLIGGLPLTLEVLGSTFSSISGNMERQTLLRELAKIPKEDIHKMLRISYDTLADEEKSIFLDAACFFIGWKKETLISIWDACGFHTTQAIKNLIQRSLLKFTANLSDSYEELRMHDEIQAMGREIVDEESPNEPGNRSRLWRDAEILAVLKQHKGTRRIEGILPLSNQLCSSVCLHREDFVMMPNLRFLNIDGAQYEGDFPHLPSSLIWFRWRGCPLEILPSNFYLKNLVHMDLTGSHIRQAWTIKPQNEHLRFQKLRSLLLRFCDQLSESFDFSWFPCLETLDLGCCRNMVNLHQSIGDLKYLVKLYLDDTKIEELPNSICRLGSLQYLNLSWCSSLKNLPESIGDLKSLIKLSLDDATKIEELPNSICRLSSLQSLTLSRCSSLRTLPESIGDLKSLVTLLLDGTAIKELPNSICKLSSLEKLNLDWCESLNKLPASIGDLKSLVELSICGTKFKELPNDVGLLRKLDSPFIG